MTNEVGSLSTPKKGNPDVLGDAKDALANTLINNANLDNPAKVAPATRQPTTPRTGFRRTKVTRIITTQMACGWRRSTAARGRCTGRVRAANLAETGLTGTINEEYIYFNGERIARIDRPTGTVNYYFSNHLGSASVITSATAVIQEQMDFYPFGGVAYSSGSDPNHYKFTGKERDSESGLDNFGARYFTSSLGRFMTPDWATRPTAVPYAVFGDPQSLNLYTYVRNDPVTRADADGHYEINASGCVANDSKCQKKWDKAVDKFEKRRERDLNSKKADVRTTAAAYGAQGEANGVHVGFASLASQGINGSVDASGSTLGAVNIQVTLDFGRAGSAETQTHEGTHVIDDKKFLGSFNPLTGGYGSNAEPDAWAN